MFEKSSSCSFSTCCCWNIRWFWFDGRVSSYRTNLRIRRTILVAIFWSSIYLVSLLGYQYGFSFCLCYSCQSSKENSSKNIHNKHGEISREILKELFVFNHDLFFFSFCMCVCVIEKWNKRASMWLILNRCHLFDVQSIGQLIKQIIVGRILPFVRRRRRTLLAHIGSVSYFWDKFVTHVLPDFGVKWTTATAATCSSRFHSMVKSLFPCFVLSITHLSVIFQCRYETSSASTRRWTQ